jgi:hypothetical protein
MHSRELMIVWDIAESERYDRMIDDLPVAVSPWATSSGGEGSVDYIC